MLKDYQLYAHSVFSPLIKADKFSFDHWYPSPSGWIMINLEVALSKRVSVGLVWVAQHEHRRVLEIGFKRLDVDKSAEMAECEVARFTLTWAKNKVGKKVVIESKSLWLISRPQLGRRGHTYLGIILEDILSLAQLFESL